MQLYIYKRGQGYYTRLWGSIACFAIIAIGCFSLYRILSGTTSNPWIYTVIPVAVLVGFTYLVYWLQNRPSIADFLITAESELKKVTWSSKEQIIASTIIVIFVVIVLSVMLGSVDVGFRSLFQFIGLYG